MSVGLLCTPRILHHGNHESSNSQGCRKMAHTKQMQARIGGRGNPVKAVEKYEGANGDRCLIDIYRDLSAFENGRSGTVGIV